MNCRDAETQILAARDTPQGAADAAILDQHLQECPRCQALSDQLSAATLAWRDADNKVVTPDSTAEWHAVRRRIREGNAAPAATGGLPSWSRLLRTAVPLAAALAIAINFWPKASSPESPIEAPLLAQKDWESLHDHFTFVAHAEYVETEDEEISPFVYVDEESGWLIVWATDVTENPSI